MVKKRRAINSFRDKLDCFVASHIWSDWGQPDG